MQLSSIITLTIAAILSGPTLACKCTTNGSEDSARTESCCGSLSGTYSDGDCAAGSISESLSDFRSCCGGLSDCDFPKKREDEGETLIVPTTTPAA